MTDENKVQFENIKRQQELNMQAISRIEEMVINLTPKELDGIVIQKEQIKNEAKKRDMTNDLAWAYVCLFGLIVIVVYSITALMIVYGFAEMLEKIEKLNFVVLGGGMTLMGYLGGYYFNQSKEK